MAAPPTAQDKVLYRYLTRRSSKGLGGLEPGVEPSGSLGFNFWYQKFTLGVAALGAERCNKEFTHCYAVCISDRDSGVSRGRDIFSAKGRGIACSAGGAGRRGRTDALIKDLLAVRDASTPVGLTSMRDHSEAQLVLDHEGRARDHLA